MALEDRLSVIYDYVNKLTHIQVSFSDMSLWQVMRTKQTDR